MDFRKSTAWDKGRLFDFCVGTHHGVRAPERNREHSIRGSDKRFEYGVHGALTVEHRDFDVQFDQRGQTVNGLSEVDWLGVKVDFFDFGVGTHHAVRAPDRNREHSTGDQLSALNVGFKERLQTSPLTKIHSYNLVQGKLYFNFPWQIKIQNCAAS